VSEWIDVQSAKTLPGLRLVITQGVPGPWGEAAKGVFRVKGVPFAKVIQRGAQPNQELFDWLGHRNAPIAVYGISLGGVFASALAIRHKELCDRLILSAPAFASRIKVPLARRLRVLRRSFTNPTRLYDLPFGPKDIVERDDWRTALEGDELRTRRISARFLTSMFKCQRFAARPVR